MSTLTEFMSPKADAELEPGSGTGKAIPVLFLVILLIVLVASLSYVVGRTAQQGQGVLAGGFKPAEQLIIVDPARGAGQPKEVSKPAAVRVEAAAGASPVAVAPPVVEAGSGGQLYYQVAAVDRGMAEVSKEFLQRKSLPVRLIEGPTPGVQRVLVGPVNAVGEQERCRAILEQAGFRYFLRKN